MGYYNPANGVTVNFTPTKSFYVNLGVYDGNRANGVQTGVSPPMFNGYWFNIGEVGVNWLLGEGNHPGQFGIGLWRQTGVLVRPRHHRGRHRRLLPVRLTTRRLPRQPEREQLVDLRLLPGRRQRLSDDADDASTTAPASPASA